MLIITFPIITALSLSNYLLYNFCNLIRYSLDCSYSD